MRGEDKTDEAVQALRELLGASYPESTEIQSVVVIASVVIPGRGEPVAVFGMDSGDDSIPIDGEVNDAVTDLTSPGFRVYPS